MIKISQKGKFGNLETYLEDSINFKRITKHLEEIAEKCVEKLKSVTPTRTGFTADSWNYQIERTRRTAKIIINNTNVHNGVNIAILLEYGHVGPNGSWIEGKHYIEPAVLDAYQEVIESIQKELNRL